MRWLKFCCHILIKLVNCSKCKWVKFIPKMPTKEDKINLILFHDEGKMNWMTADVYNEGYPENISHSTLGRVLKKIKQTARKQVNAYEQTYIRRKVMWNLERHAAFARLKEPLTTLPILRHPKTEAGLIWGMNSSNIGVRFILSKLRSSKNEC